MSRPTEQLIADLAADARPVRRLAPPALRATLWLALLIGLGVLAVAGFGHPADLLRRNGALPAALAWAASLATGMTAVVAAAYLSLPDRSRRWALAPLPFLALWLGASGIGCLGLPAAADAHSPKCFVFIVASGLPLAGFLFWRLRRARPIDGRLTAVMAALGAAGLSAALLQFFHPFAITWLDLAFHLAAVGTILAVGALGGRRAVDGR